MNSFHLHSLSAIDLMSFQGTDLQVKTHKLSAGEISRLAQFYYISVVSNCRIKAVSLKQIQEKVTDHSLTFRNKRYF